MSKYQNIILGIFGILIIVIIGVLYSLYSSNLVDIYNTINRNNNDRLNDLAVISKTYMPRSGGTFTGSIAVEGQITSYDIRVINTNNIMPLPIPLQQVELDELLQNNNSIIQLYDGDKIEQHAINFINSFKQAFPNFKQFFAVKALPNPHILKLFLF